MFEQGAIGNTPFLADVSRLRASAQEMIAQEAGAVPLLQAAMSAEIACVLRYSMIAVSPEGLENDWVATECAAQAADERGHMMRIAQRIVELGGKPDYFVADLATRHAAPDSAAGSLSRLFAENLAVERSVIELYRELANHFAGRDETTCVMLEDILADEETHTNDMEDLLATQLI